MVFPMYQDNFDLLIEKIFIIIILMILNKSNIWSVKCTIINVPGLAVVVGVVVAVDVVPSVVGW